jgi:hypothetical protein
MADVRRVMRRAGLACAFGAAVLLALWLDPFGWRGDPALERALTERGRVAVVGPSRMLGLRAQGTTLVDARSSAPLARALAAGDANALVQALAQAHLDALLIQPDLSSRAGASLESRLAHYQHVDGLRGLYLSYTAALFAPDVTSELLPEQRDALAVVARAIVGGARPPRVSSFPEPLRRLRPVEVMVLLREHERARLWRSARGSSIASALVTAASVARQRWQEREQAMGAPLEKALPRLNVDVALLEDDGTIGERAPAFIDRVFFLGVHGVGYERKGAWRYLLPEATQEESKGHPSQAYRKLFSEDGLPQDSFDRHELRLYRLVLQTIATSPAPPASPDDGLNDVKSPEDVLGHAP